MSVFYYIIQTPLGPLTAIEEKQSLVNLFFRKVSDLNAIKKKTPLFAKLEKELNDYFAGKLRVFSIPMTLKGTDFQKRVWQALQTIPYGEVITYQDLAIRIGQPKACRAVGMANHRNNLPILIPCHRVIGKKGHLVGYSDGVEKKAFLLKLEKESLL